MQASGKQLWIDGHTHLDLHREDGSPYGYKLDDVLQVLDASGGDLRLMISIGANEIRRAGADPELIHQANEDLYQFIRPSEGRLMGCCFVRPDALAQAHADLDLYVGKRGFVQVGEIVGQVEGGLVDGIYGRMDSPAMIEIARHAAQLGVPLQFHCSTHLVPTGIHAQQTLHVAREVPEAKVILAHAIGGRNTYLHILAAETYLADGGDNIYLEIYSFNVRAYLTAAYERLGADRLLVGTDWATRDAPPFAPYGTQINVLRHPDWWRGAHLQGLSQWDSQLWLNTQLVLDLRETPYPCSVSSYVGFLREAGIAEEDVEKIGSGNAIRLFQLRERGLT